LGRSLGRRSDGRIYVNLGFFSIEGNPWFLWGSSIVVVYYTVCEEKRRDCVRAKRKLHHICCRLYLFILLYNIKGRTKCFSMDVAQIWWTMYICVSLALWFSLFIFRNILYVPLLYYLISNTFFWIWFSSSSMAFMQCSSFPYS